MVAPFFWHKKTGANPTPVFSFLKDNQTTLAKLRLLRIGNQNINHANAWHCLWNNLQGEQKRP